MERARQYWMPQQAALWGVPCMICLWRRLCMNWMNWLLKSPEEGDMLVSRKVVEYTHLRAYQSCDSVIQFPKPVSSVALFIESSGGPVLHLPIKTLLISTFPPPFPPQTEVSLYWHRSVLNSLTHHSLCGQNLNEAYLPTLLRVHHWQWQGIE